MDCFNGYIDSACSLTVCNTEDFGVQYKDVDLYVNQVSPTQILDEKE